MEPPAASELRIAGPVKPLLARHNGPIRGTDAFAMDNRRDKEVSTVTRETYHSVRGICQQLPTILDAVAKERQAIVVERNGQLYRLTPQPGQPAQQPAPQDIWQGYDPERVKVACSRALAPWPASTARSRCSRISARNVRRTARPPRVTTMPHLINSDWTIDYLASDQQAPQPLAAAGAGRHRHQHLHLYGGLPGRPQEVRIRNARRQFEAFLQAVQFSRFPGRWRSAARASAKSSGSRVGGSARGLGSDCGSHRP